MLIRFCAYFLPGLPSPYFVLAGDFGWQACPIRGLPTFFGLTGLDWREILVGKSAKSELCQPFFSSLGWFGGRFRLASLLNQHFANYFLAHWVGLTGNLGWQVRQIRCLPTFFQLAGLAWQEILVGNPALSRVCQSFIGNRLAAGFFASLCGRDHSRSYSTCI